MFIAQIDGKEVELKASDLKPKEGYAIITPDSVPDGYYSEQALQQKIKDRTKNTAENAVEEALDKPEFQKRILDKYGISLDKEGKPKGLKPDVDVDEVKRTVAEQIKTEYEAKLNQLQSSLDGFKSKGLTGAIVGGANKIGIDGKYLEPLVEGGSPYLVKELSDQFAWNDEIGDYALKDKDGTFAVDGNGFVTTQKFFEKNTEKFKHMLKDQRQRGSNFSGQGLTSNGKPKGNPAEWKRDVKLKFIEENGHDGYKKALNDFKGSKED